MADDDKLAPVSWGDHLVPPKYNPFPKTDLSAPAKFGWPLCSACGLRASSHVIDRNKDACYLCCECYIDEGFLPNDAHQYCVMAWKRKTAA